MWHYVERSTAWMSGLSSAEWLGVMVLVLIVGFLCLKGFGSRKAG